jgi:CheY-like chemotaxis protein
VSKKITILVVDDEAIVRQSIAMLLAHAGHTVAVAADGEGALTKLSEGHFDLIITDFSMPGIPGDELARRIRERWPGQPIIMVTAFVEEYELFSRDRRTVDALLLKPFAYRELNEAIDRVLAGKSAPSQSISAPLQPENNPKIIKNRPET